MQGYIGTRIAIVVVRGLDWGPPLMGYMGLGLTYCSQNAVNSCGDRDFNTYPIVHTRMIPDLGKFRYTP